VAANGGANAGAHAERLELTSQAVQDFCHGLLDVEGFLMRAALLAGYGAKARPLARRLAAAVHSGDGRSSCLDAGAPIQLTVDAPGPAGLRVGLRLGDDFCDAAVAGLVPREAASHLRDFLRPLPRGAHAGLGTWLFWTETRQSIFVDLRDADPFVALARLRRVLDRDQQMRLEDARLALKDARPWVLRVEADAAGVVRLHMHWLLSRYASPAKVAETIAPGCWPRVMDVLARLVRRPGASGRWVVATPLDDCSGPTLRIGNSGWAFVAEDEQKHRSVGELMRALGGTRDYAEALWSMCRGAARSRWRVGRACELKVDAAGVRARLFFVPQVHTTAATAGTSSSGTIATG
jgi:hypothetical protein